MEFKALIRDSIAGVLGATGLTRRLLDKKEQWLVLTFHRVLPAELKAGYPLPNLVVTPTELEWIIETLQPLFDIRSISDATACLMSGERVASAKPLLSFTFDDGQWDNYQFAMPVLQRYNISATFYLPTDFISTSNLLWHDQAAFAWLALAVDPKCVKHVVAGSDRELLDAASASSFVNRLKQLDSDYRVEFIDRLRALCSEGVEWARMMTWEEVSEMAELGHELGSHGKTHKLMTQQSIHEQRDELVRSRKVIAEKTAINVKSYCYPNGSYNSATLDLLDEDLGYSSAVTTSWGWNDVNQSSYEIRRCDMNVEHLCGRHGVLSRDRLFMRLSGLLSKGAR